MCYMGYIVGAEMNKKILPPTWLLLCIVLMFVLHFFMPLKTVIPSPYKYLGAVFIVLGIWINLSADGLFKRHDTTVKPFEKSTSLVIKGPFKFSRNPMYLGFVIILLGMSIMLGSVSSFSGPVILFIVMDRCFITAEEKMLAEEFGSEFEEYKKQVRRWI